MRLHVHANEASYCASASFKNCWRTVILMFAVLVSGMSGFAQHSTTENDVATKASSPAPDLRISAGDLLEISVFEVPELTTRARVNSRGDVLLPLIGSVHLEGQTADAAAHEIEQRLRGGGYVRAPQATVFISQYATQGVAVLGEVKKPGVYPLLGSRHLFDFISVAEGLTSAAGKTISITHHDSSDGATVVQWTGASTADPKVNPSILPGDTIVVAKAGVVYVVGDVGKPGGFVMDHKERLTVLQALALAQGTNRTANLGAVKLIHNANGERVETTVALNKILSDKAADVQLQDDDIVFVPSSGKKMVAFRSIEAIVQTATGLAVYHP